MLLQLFFVSDITIRFAGMEVCLKQCSPPKKKTEKNCSWKRDKKSFVTICCWLKTQFLSFTSSGNSCCRNLLVAKIRQTEVLLASLNTYQSFHKKNRLELCQKMLLERRGSSHEFTIEFLWHEQWTLIWIIIIGFQDKDRCASTYVQLLLGPFWLMCVSTLLLSSSVIFFANFFYVLCYLMGELLQVVDFYIYVKLNFIIFFPS